MSRLKVGWNMDVLKCLARVRHYCPTFVCVYTIKLM